jgi:hypothetical protein
LRLLLDEHFAREIAQGLRARGYEVVVVAERPDLRNLPDEELWIRAARERRAIVTEDARDITRLLQATPMDDLHWGVVFTSRRRYPRDRAGIGRLIQALEALLRANPDDSALQCLSRWL